MNTQRLFYVTHGRHDSLKHMAKKIIRASVQQQQYNSKQIQFFIGMILSIQVTSHDEQS
jgi:hypothetical protein